MWAGGGCEGSSLGPGSNVTAAHPPQSPGATTDEFSAFKGITSSCHQSQLFVFNST